MQTKKPRDLTYAELGKKVAYNGNDGNKVTGTLTHIQFYIGVEYVPLTIGEARINAAFDAEVEILD